MKKVIKYWQLYVFLLPAVLLVFIFNYLPIYGIQIAFKNFDASKGIWGSEWVGMAHFARLVNLPAFREVIVNTFSLSLLNLILGFPFPILLALLINQLRSEKYKKLIQTATYLPHFISTVVIVGMILVFLSPRAGLYGNVMRFIGSEPVNLMGQRHMFRWVYVFSEIWQRTGFNSIIYLAAISSIDPSLYEAATIDGANRWQRMIYIDIPYLVPTMVILLILSAGNVLNVGFDKVFLMQNASNLGVSEVISTYVYKVGIISAQFSFSAAVGLLNTVINFTFLVAVNMLSRKLGDTSLW